MSTISIERLNVALQGRYAIERELGEGGMATVFLAEDQKHNRRVALKVLKPELAAVVGADRFLTEIETTAKLQHPHILPLFDSGEADSFLFYVMPFVEGETLRARLDRDRQLPVDEAVRIASDVAEALDYAHRHGIVHRDIKPGNILLHEGRPLIADFGIALAVGAAGGTRLTETGLSVGTPYYMSPEQATGDQIIGPASDIYSVACVLYEMLVGEPPYVGATAQAVLGKIISGGVVSATEQRRSIPPNVDGAIRKALEKLPADRFSTGRDFAAALADPRFRHGDVEREETAPGPWNRVSLAMTGVAVLFAAAFAWVVTRPDPVAPVTRLSVRFPEGQLLPGAAPFDLSTDGTALVYLGPGATEGAPAQLWMRRWDALEATPIGDTDGAAPPAISPNGEEVAFLSSGELRIVPLQGGVGRTLGGEGLVPFWIRWGPDGRHIYFTVGGPDAALYRIPAAGGDPERVVPLDSTQVGNMYFDVLPGDRGIVVEMTYATGPALHAVDLETREITPLVEGSFPRYANGYLLFGSPDGTTLMSAPLDLDRLEFTEQATPLAQGLASPASGWHFFAASPAGTLIYATGTPVSMEYEIVSVSREGVITSLDPAFRFDPGDNNRGLSLSPDGTRLALTIFEDGNYDIWVKELPRGPRTRVSFSDGWDVRPRWSPDGRFITYLSQFGPDITDVRVVSMRPSGTGEPVELMNHDLPLWEAIYSPDMEWLIARTGGSTTVPGGRDVWTVRSGSDSLPRTLIVTDYDEKAIDISPDGRWFLYESDETGRNEVYVRPFPNVDDDKITISTAGGVMPRWSRGGREIFYVNAAGEMMAATVETGERFRVIDRAMLYELDPRLLFRQGEQYALYDLTPDDSVFIMFRSLAEGDTDAELIYVQNWMEAAGR